MAKKKEKKGGLSGKELEDFREKQRKVAAKIEMVSKMADRQKEGGYRYPDPVKSKKVTDTEAALNTFEAQKISDRLAKKKSFLDTDRISDRKLSKKEGSFKNGGRVVGIAKRGFGRALKRK